MNRWVAVATASLALLGVFALIAVSVVSARRPLDPKVWRSFQTEARHAGGTPLACRKTTVDFYDCSAVLPRRRTIPRREIHFQLWLRDDGCWGAQVKTPLAAQQQYAPLKGCIATG
jgi:hypothetical protein